MNRLRLGIVTCGFLGCAPVAPGTFGTLGGVLAAWALASTNWFALWVTLLCLILYWVGRSLAPWSEERAGGKDPGFFVLDEVIGYLVTILWLQGPSLLTLCVGFIVFRFFDIFKPPPIRRFERIPGGDGILLDDVIAGLYGLAVMAVLRAVSGDPSIWIAS